MAGLYGDLPSAKNDSDAPAWGAIPKLQPQLKKPALAPPPSLLRAGRGGGRTPTLAGRGSGRGPGIKTEPGSEPAAGTLVQPAVTSIFSSVKDEYDPMKPNDYEALLKERERAKREAEAEAERMAKVREMEAAMERLKQQEGSADVRAAALNISGEEAYLRRGGKPVYPQPPATPASAEPSTGGLGLGLGLGLGASPAGETTQPAGAANNPNAAAGGGDKGMTLAQKMLMKMGWKEGEGLGRDRQGISTPLVMQKTNARAGVIVNAEPVAGQPPEKRHRSGAAIVGQPSRVLCLRNMVGPGEVDEELDGEVGNECTKYGNVLDVLIFEVTTPGYAPEEAVRIFIEFDRMECAMKALIDLQGRFFGGREVRAAFFSEARFKDKQLAPQAGEFD